MFDCHRQLLASDRDRVRFRRWGTGWRISES
jgi:hypothetical protein